MKNNFLKFSLSLLSLVTMLSLLAACGDATAPNVSSTPGNPTPTGTPGTTVAVVPVITATVTVSTTTAVTITSAPISTTATLPTVTQQPTTKSAAPTATATPVVPTATVTSEPTASVEEPTVTPAPDDTTEPGDTSAPAPGTTFPGTLKPGAITIPPVKGTLPAATPTLSTKSQAVLSGKITFEADGKIYLVNPNGSGLQQIAFGHSPVFSPDGQRIAYISGDEAGINSVDLNGGTLQFHCATEGQFSRTIRWSPNGKYLAIFSQKGDSYGLGAVQFCNMTYKGIGALETFTAGNEKSQDVFDWSLDGKKVLFQTASQSKGQTPDYDLWYGNPNDPASQWQSVTAREYQEDLGLGLRYLTGLISPTNKTVAIVGSKIFFKSTPGYQSSYDGLVLNEFEDATAIAWAPDSTAMLVVGVYKGEPGMYLRYFDNGKVTRLTDFIPSGYVDWTRK